MELSGITCSGCGSSDVTFDAENRILICNQCGKREYYSRSQLAMNGKVVLVLDNAIKAFTSGNRETARRFAGDVLNVMLDSLPALFILSYLDEYELGKYNSIRDFFREADGIKEVEGDEIRDLLKLFIAAKYNLRGYEEEMLTLVIPNMQSPKDRDCLENFIDTISPYCISRYPSDDFMTEKRCELYSDIAANCNIPKTCITLLKGIKTNPDSPYVTNTFSMRARSEHFFNNYVKRVGKIISSMKKSDYSSKFAQAYAEAEKDFISELNENS